MKNLALKLLEVQKELGIVLKDADNPFYKTAYASINAYIDAIKPILSKHGIVILQPLTTDGVATLLIDTASGESMQTAIKLPEIADPQKMGSAITYFRRYSLQSLFVIKAVDDDGSSAKDGLAF